MSCSEYSKIMNVTTPSFEGNKVTQCCRSFLEGLLEKDFEKRLSYDRAMSHPWIVLIKKKIDDVVEKFGYDPDKMIHMLNTTLLEDDYFDSKKNSYVKFEINRNEDEQFSNKKRKRQFKLD